jgi:hypothetical protein
MGTHVCVIFEQISFLKLGEHLVELVHGELLALTIAN